MVLFAHVFQRAGRLFVRTLSKTTAGVLLGSGEMIVLPAEATNANLGDAVRRALENSRDQLPHPAPADWSDVTKRFLASVGAKSMAAFMKGAVCVTAVQNGAQIALEPTRNGGAREGFVDLADRKIRLDAQSTPEEVGGAVREALRLSI